MLSIPVFASEMANTSGEISETEDRSLASRFEWRMTLIASDWSNRNNACQSPMFRFCDGEWTLELTTRGNKVDIYLNRSFKILCHSYSAECELITKASNGAECLRSGKSNVEVKNLSQCLLTKNGNFFGFNSYFDVIITCSLRCCGCKSTNATKGHARLGRILWDFFISGEDSDLTIKVRERVFKVHKMIIRAQSPVFFSMLKHDMAEGRQGCVDIPDCEPEAFQLFLEYLYSGEFKDFSMDSVYSVYYIADKYEVPELKEQCVEFMVENLSLESFFDIATLSARHNDEDLLKSANAFFSCNVKAIVQTEEWVTFLKENPVAANDFLKGYLVPEVHQKIKRKLELTTGLKKRRNDN